MLDVVPQFFFEALPCARCFVDSRWLKQSHSFYIRQFLLDNWRLTMRTISFCEGWWRRMIYIFIDMTYDMDCSD
jgi:hypothetical protein